MSRFGKHEECGNDNMTSIGDHWQQKTNRFVLKFINFRFRLR